MSTSTYTPAHVLRAAVRRTYSDAPSSVVFRRDLERPVVAPQAKIPITVRRADAADRPAIAALVAELSGPERRTRELFLSHEVGGGYVAVTDDGQICFMQWLLGPESNGWLERHTSLPRPKPGEALLENAYTPVAFRGLGILTAAMAEIVEHAADLGARWVLTVVNERNAASIKACLKLGFEPYMLKLDHWRLFHHEIRYTALPADYRLELAR